MAVIPAFPEQPAAFLRLLLAGEDVPDGYELLLWTLPDKRSHWCPTVAEGASVALRLGHTLDTYVGMSLRHASFAVLAGPDRRGAVAECAALGCLWGDIDYNDGIHPRKGYFESAEQALAFIEQLPLRPTMIVHSGGGYHAYWCFKELWILDSREEHEEAQLLAIRWRETLKAWARRRDATVDSVGDLARVMRVPGTFNMKDTDAPRQCEIVSWEPERRYDPTHFEEYLVSFDVSVPIPESAPYPFVLDPHALPPLDKWEALKAADERAERSYQYARKDLKDQSPSAYDMSLATFAVRARWTDQEIVNLLIACRREHKEDLKLRYSYYGPTVAKARQNVRYDEALEDLLTLPDEPAEGLAWAPPEEEEAPDGPGAATLAPPGAPLVDLPNPALNPENTQMIDILEAILGFRIRRIARYAVAEPVYTLETSAGVIELGTVGNLIEQNPFRKKVAALTGLLIPPIAKDRWQKVAQLLLNLCVTETTGPDTSVIGRVEEWLLDYLEAWPPVDLVNAEMELLQERKGYIAQTKMAFQAWSSVEKRVYLFLFLTSLKDWLFKARGEIVTGSQLAVMLRMCGWEPKQYNLPKPGGEGETTRSVWRRALHDAPRRG